MLANPFGTREAFHVSKLYGFGSCGQTMSYAHLLVHKPTRYYWPKSATKSTFECFTFIWKWNSILIFFCHWQAGSILRPWHIFHSHLENVRRFLSHFALYPCLCERICVYYYHWKWKRFLQIISFTFIFLCPAMTHRNPKSEIHLRHVALIK